MGDQKVRDTRERVCSRAVPGADSAGHRDR